MMLRLVVCNSHHSEISLMSSPVKTGEGEQRSLQRSGGPLRAANGPDLIAKQDGKNEGALPTKCPHLPTAARWVPSSPASQERTKFAPSPVLRSFSGAGWERVRNLAAPKRSFSFAKARAGGEGALPQLRAAEFCLDEGPSAIASISRVHRTHCAWHALALT